MIMMMMRWDEDDNNGEARPAGDTRRSVDAGWFRDQISAGRTATIEQMHGGVGGGESRNNQRVKEEVVGRW